MGYLSAQSSCFVLFLIYYAENILNSCQFEEKLHLCYPAAPKIDAPNMSDFVIHIPLPLEQQPAASRACARPRMSRLASPSFLSL